MEATIKQLLLDNAEELFGQTIDEKLLEKFKKVYTVYAIGVEINFWYDYLYRHISFRGKKFILILILK